MSDQKTQNPEKWALINKDQFFKIMYMTEKSIYGLITEFEILMMIQHRGLILIMRSPKNSEHFPPPVATQLSSDPTNFQLTRD